MGVRSFVVLHFLAALALLSLAAPVSAAPSAYPGTQGEKIFVRPEGPFGPLVAYEIATGKPAFKLPAGMLSTDRSVFYSAPPDGENTLVKAFATTGGDQAHILSLDGRWNLRGVSPNGKWLALIEIPSEAERSRRASNNEWTTRIQVVDAETGEATNNLELDGHFEIDTISDSGESLFLTQYIPSNDPEHYFVRLYDLTIDYLDPNPLKDKRNQDEVMTGLAWNGVATPNGVYQLTLYLNTEHNMAFIHSLNLVEKWPLCIFLPSGQGDFEALKGYQITLSPDGQRVFATNASLGFVVEVSLSTQEVTHVEAFDPVKSAGSVATTISPDGKSLYFSVGDTIWSYDTTTKKVVHTYAVLDDVIALQLTSDGRALIAASASTSNPLTAIDLATGATDSFWGT